MARGRERGERGQLPGMGHQSEETLGREEREGTDRETEKDRGRCRDREDEKDR